MKLITAGPAIGNDPFVEPEAIEVSIVMPCLNEARTVGRCVRIAIEALSALGVHGEVVVADNGSTDQSRALASEQGARVVPAPQRGYGNALQAGIAAARGKYVIMADSDESCNFAEIGPFLQRLRAGDDLVVGNRFQGGIRPGAMPWLHRYVGNPVLTGILNLFFRTPIGDAHCGFRGFRKDSYRRLGLSSPGMEFASEMIVKAALHAQRMTEVPVVLHKDGRDRPPHLRSFPDGWRHLRFLLSMAPDWLFLIPALLLLAAGLTCMSMGAATMGVWISILGYQWAWLWPCAKTHVWKTNHLPAAGWSFRLINALTPMPGLLAGSGMILTAIVMSWFSGSQHGFWAVLGVQTIVSTLLLSQVRRQN